MRVDKSARGMWGDSKQKLSNQAQGLAMRIIILEILTVLSANWELYK